jgi:hypothetical protein
VRKPVCASATAATVATSGLGEPTYVITGWRKATQSGNDDLHTAQLIERVRVGQPARALATAAAVRKSREAVAILRPRPRTVTMVGIGSHAIPFD